MKKKFDLPKIKRLNVMIIILLIIIILVILGITFCVIDTNLLEKNKKPIFTFYSYLLRDGGTTVYIGLGYKIYRYANILSNQVHIKSGTLFLKYDNPITF